MEIFAQRLAKFCGHGNTTLAEIEVCNIAKVKTVVMLELKTLFHYELLAM